MTGITGYIEENMILDSSEKSISYGKRIDFHTHILPNMDDGSSSVEMSMRMLQMEHRQGTVCVVLTPHFYASRHTPEQFLQKRAYAMQMLKKTAANQKPVLAAGAEVEYFEGITAMQELKQMRMGKSTGLLIEMPMSTWSNRMIGDIAELNSRQEYQIILAHVERYLPFRNLAAIRCLASSGVLMQVNASFFSGMFRSAKALQMLDEGLIHLLGSDCHNLTSRPPNLADAYTFIEKKRGKAAVKKIMDNGLQLLIPQDSGTKPARADRE